MRKKGWNLAAGLMDYWFAGSGQNFYIDLTTIENTNSEVRTKINKLKSDKMFTDNLKKLLVTELEKTSVNGEQKSILKLNYESQFNHILTELGRIPSGYQPKIEEEPLMHYIAEEKVSSYDVSQEFTGAFANIALRLVTAGSVKPLGGDLVRVTVTDGAVYVRDKYDFEGGQPLGCWQYSAPYVVETDPANIVRFSKNAGYVIPTCLTVNNALFRQYNKNNGKSESTGDFRIFSFPTKNTFAYKPSITFVWDIKNKKLVK